MTYVFVAPAVCLCGLYLSTFLAANSRQGAVAIAAVVSEVVAGELDFEFVSIGHDLVTAQVFDAQLRDLNGRTAIEARSVRCRFSPGGLVRRRVLLDDCYAEDGRFLIEEQRDGGVGFMQAISGRFRAKRNLQDPPVTELRSMELRDFEVLISTEDLMMRFDDVHLWGGRIEGGRGFFELDAWATAASGRVLASERLFSLGDGKDSWDAIAWDINRANRPWAAAWADTPDPGPDGRGLLDVPLDRVNIERLRLRDEDIEVERLEFLGEAFSFDGEGLVRLMPERPKLARHERAVLAYDGDATITVPPDSSALAWVLPGLISAASADSEIAPFVFDGFGSVRFFDGETRLRALDVQAGPVRLDEVDVGLSWHDGVMQTSDDARMVVGGGEVTGGGTMTPADGLWHVGLCAEDVDLARALGVDSDSPGAAWLSATLSTRPGSCDEDTGALEMWGDLTLKAFELSPARTTPLDKEIQPPMIALRTSGLTLVWDAPPDDLPLDFVTASVDASLDQRGVLTLGTERDGLRLRAGDHTFSAGGTLDLVDARFEDLRVAAATSALGAWLAALGSPLAPRGLRAEASATLDGDWAAPRVSNLRAALRADGEDPSVPELSADAQLAVDGDALVIRDLDLSSPVGTGAARGAITLFDGSVWRVRDNPGLDLTAVLDGVEVGALAPDLGVDAEVDATFSVSGSAASPRVQGSRLEVLDFRVFGEPIDYLALGGFSVDDGGFSTEDIFVVKGKGSLEGDLAVDFGAETIEAALRGRRFRLDELRAAQERGMALEGDVDFDINVSGPFDDPRIGGRMSSTDLRIEGLEIGALTATAYAFDGALELAGHAATDFNLNARVPLDGGPWQLGVSFANVPLGEHVASLRGVFDRARVSGDLLALLDPFGERTYGATLRLTEVDLRAAKRRFTLPQPASVTWNARHTDVGFVQRFDISEFSVESGERALRMGGFLSLEGSESEVLIDVSGGTDLALLRMFPELVVDAEGDAELTLRVAGTLEDASVTGALEFEQARVSPRGLGTSVSLAPGRIEIGDGAFTIPETRPLNGTLFGGDFSLWGDVGLRGVVPANADLRIFVTNLAYRVPDTVNVTLTSENLRFRAGDFRDYDTWSVGGDVELVDARYYEDIEVVSGSLSFGGFGRTVDAVTLPIWMTVPAIGRMRADLRITGRDRFLVDNTIASAEMELEFRTDLELTGRFDAMELVGEMEALEGSTVTYRGNEFDVVSATLTFRGARDERGYPIPVLDSELTASIRPCSRRADDLSTFDIGDSTQALDESQEVFLTAFVRGQLPADLSFQLQSTPFYDQRDQLSLILTGCTVDELTAGSAGGRTLEVVLGPIIDVVERNVEERLDLDTVDLVPSGDGSAGISIQDDVSERFTWGLDANLGTDSTRQVLRGEYRLFDWLLIEVQEETSQQESISVDTGLRFRIRLD